MNSCVLVQGQLADSYKHGVLLCLKCTHAHTTHTRVYVYVCVCVCVYIYI
jgi:hypothetical protein